MVRVLLPGPLRAAQYQAGQSERGILRDAPATPLISAPAKTPNGCPPGSPNGRDRIAPSERARRQRELPEVRIADGRSDSRMVAATANRSHERGELAEKSDNGK